MPIDYSKFDNIEDSDDEAEKARNKVRGGNPISQAPQAPKAPAPKAAASKDEIGEEHRRALEDAPVIELASGGYLAYYAEKMTAPQRMQTLIMLWNSAPQDERVIFLRHLIAIIDDPKVSNRIKGGQEILKDLDTNYYAGVTYPQSWIDQFNAGLEVDSKKVVFEKMFKTLGPQEQGLVLGTLM